MYVETVCQIWDLLAPFFRLHGRQESLALSLDHAEEGGWKPVTLLDEQRAERSKLGMTWDSAYPPSCRAPHEGGWAETPYIYRAVDRITVTQTIASRKSTFHPI